MLNVEMVSGLIHSSTLFVNKDFLLLYTRALGSEWVVRICTSENVMVCVYFLKELLWNWRLPSSVKVVHETLTDIVPIGRFVLVS